MIEKQSNNKPSKVVTCAKISKWADEQHKEIRREAQQHFLLVGIVILLGIVAAIILPKLIQTVDSFWLSESRAPTEELLQIHSQVQEIASLINDRKKRAEQNANAVAKQEAIIEDLDEKIRSAKNLLSSSLITVWRRAEIIEPNNVWDVTSIAEANGKWKFVAGAIDGDPGGSSPIVVLFSLDGRKWSRRTIKFNGIDVLGVITSIKTLESGDVFFFANLHNRANTAVFKYKYSEDDFEEIGLEGLHVDKLISLTVDAGGTIYALAESNRQRTLHQKLRDLAWEQIALPNTHLNPIGIEVVNDGTLILVSDGEDLKVFEKKHNHAWMRADTPHIARNTSINGLKVLGDKLVVFGQSDSRSFALSRDKKGKWENLDLNSAGEVISLTEVNEDYVIILELQKTDDLGNRRKRRVLRVISSQSTLNEIDLDSSTIGLGINTPNSIASSDDGVILVAGNTAQGILFADGQQSLENLNEIIAAPVERREFGIFDTRPITIIPKAVPQWIDANINALELKRAEETNKLTLEQGLLQDATTYINELEQASVSLTANGFKLHKALEDTDSIREVAIAVGRIVVLGLLIFFVQVIVNRYRYLERLSAYYKARAQAFELLSESDEEQINRFMEGMTFPELVATLSPDSIGFGKSPDPPNAQIAALLQTALKGK